MLCRERELHPSAQGVIEMKWLLFIFLSTFLLVSCSSSDEETVVSALALKNPSCIGDKCSMRVVAEVQIQASPSNQSVVYRINSKLHDSSMFSKLDDCIVVSKESFKCSGFERVGHIFNFNSTLFPYDYLTDLKTVRWLGDSSTHDIKSLQTLEKWESPFLNGGFLLIFLALGLLSKLEKWLTEVFKKP